MKAPWDGRVWQNELASPVDPWFHKPTGALPCLTGTVWRGVQMDGQAEAGRAKHPPHLPYHPHREFMEGSPVPFLGPT